MLRAHPRIGCAPVLSGVGEFFSTVLTIGIPVWLTGQLHAGAGAYAVVLAAMGAGAVAGNLPAGNVTLPGRFPEGAYCLVWTVRGLLLAACALSGSLTEVAAIAATASVLVPLASVSLNAELGRLPGPERLRLFTADAVELHLASMGGMLMLPALLGHAPQASFVAGGLFTAAARVAVWITARTLARRPGPMEADRTPLART
ncbi:hypothetical protein ADL21_38040 [Streptomyces albus subsp. albus]|nr:hypothetical protein ADL21_38040 [Streptomyces albus subsp. albus]